MSKHGIDWSKAPRDATHYKEWFFYKLEKGVWLYHKGDYLGWNKSSNTEGWFKDAISKEEDLGMDKKEVKVVADLEVGMFLHNGTYRFFVSEIKGDIVYTLLLDRDRFVFGQTGLGGFESWSYTFNGEYIPIVKPTEAERKIKELEATIELAQKQLQEYKEMK